MKKITAFTMGIVLLIGALSGCSEVGEDYENSVELVDAGELANGSQPEIPSLFFEDPELKSEAGADPESGDIQNNSQQSSAQVSVSAAEEYSVYNIRTAEFDPEKVKQAVFGDAEITPEFFEGSHGNKHFTWKKDGRSLDISDGLISLNGKEMWFAERTVITPGDNHDGNIEDFPSRDEELDFCSRDEAVSAVRKMIDEIGVDVGDPTVYALRQSDLQNLIDKECAERGYTTDYDKLWNGEEDNKVTSYTVGKELECYYMEFRQYHNGVPLYNYDFQYMTMKDIYVMPPRIAAVYTADGIVGLRIDYSRSIISEKEKIDRLITPETAAKSVAAKYEELADIKSVLLEKLELMYVITPIFNGGKYDHEELIPAWVCTVRVIKWGFDRKAGTDGYVESKDTLWIDARTGVEII